MLSDAAVRPLPRSGGWRRADTQPEPAKNQPAAKPAASAKPAAAGPATNGGLDGYTFHAITQDHLLKGTDDPAYWLM